MYLIPVGQLAGSLLNAIFGKCFRNVRAEPYYFGMGNDIKNKGRGPPPAPIMPDAPAQDGNGNTTGNNYKKKKNMKRNIMAYHGVTTPTNQ